MIDREKNGNLSTIGTKQPNLLYDLTYDKDLAVNQWPSKLDAIKQEKEQSLMAQVMNKTIFDKYKGMKT